MQLKPGAYRAESLVLMPHQETLRDRLFNSVTHLVHGDQGIGKTAIAITAMNKLVKAGRIYKPMLWVGPTSSVLNVSREVEKFGGIEGHSVRVIRKTADWAPARPGEVLVMSYDMMVRLLPELARSMFSIFVLDEVQFCKNPRTKRTKAVFGHLSRPGLAAHADFFWAMSGTPAPNHFGELYPFLREAGLASVSYDTFVRRHCRIREDRFGYKIVGNNRPAIDQLMGNASEVYSRIRKSEVLTDLPPITFNNVQVSGDRTMRKQLAAIEDGLRPQIDALIKTIRYGETPPVEEVASLRRLTEIAKVGEAIEIVSAELSDRAINKIVIFATHRDTIAALEEGLSKFGVRVIHGSVSVAKRQRAIDDFQDDPTVRVFVGQTVAAGTAITLHANGACQDVLFVSADWVPSNNAQAVARVHRKGQIGNVHARFLHLENSIDEAVQRAVMHKTRMLSEIFKDERSHHAA